MGVGDRESWFLHWCFIHASVTKLGTTSSVPVLSYYMVALKLSGDLESILFTDVAPEPGLFWAYIHVKCMNARMHDPDSVFALFSLCCLLTDF